LEPRQQRIGSGQFVDAAATLGTIAEVGRGARQLRLGEPAKGQRT
jgi:hypothetical protein